MAIKQKIIFVTSDGKEFDLKQTAEKHQESITGLAKFYTFERTPHNVITHDQAKEIVQWQMSNECKNLTGGNNESTCWHYGKVEIFQLLDFIYGYNLTENQKPPLFKL